MPKDTKTVHYNDIRDQIEDCDVFLFRGNVFMSRIFEDIKHLRFVGGQKNEWHYSHAALVGWWDDRMMIFQAELSGVQTIPLSVAVGTYDGRADWYKPVVPDGETLDKKAILDEAKADLGLDYSISVPLKDMIKTAFHQKLPANARDPHALFCSQYVERAFRIGGFPLVDVVDVLAAPTDLAESGKLRYMGSVEHDPSHVINRRKDAVDD